MKLTSIILAAGQGKRMHSDLPKVLHPILGLPMVLHALRIVQGLTDELPVVVTGHGGDAVRQAISGRARWVVQEQQLGTAHAVRQAESVLRGQDPQGLILVTHADMPLLRPESMARLVETQTANPGPLTIATVLSDDSHGFGRVLRGPDGSVQAIVEEAQATPEILAIRELNVGAYCIRADWLWDALARVQLSPKGEYYLTDLVALAAADGLPVQGETLEEIEEAIGVNNRVHLAEAERVMRARVNTAWLLKGVTMIDPLAVTVEPDVIIGPDTVIWPGTLLAGQTRVGRACRIGPNSVIRDAVLGDNCQVEAAWIEGALLEENVWVGPYCHLPPGTRLARGTRLDSPSSRRMALEMENRD